MRDHVLEPPSLDDDDDGPARGLSSPGWEVRDSAPIFCPFVHFFRWAAGEN